MKSPSSARVVSQFQHTHTQNKSTSKLPTGSLLDGISINMPTANRQQYALSSVARDMQSNGLSRSHHSYASSQTSLQKLPVQTTQYYYPMNNSSFAGVSANGPSTTEIKQTHTIVTANNLMSQSNNNTMHVSTNNMHMVSPENTVTNNYSNYIQMPPVPQLPQTDNNNALNQSAILMSSSSTQKIHQHQQQTTPVPQLPPPPKLHQQHTPQLSLQQHQLNHSTQHTNQQHQQKISNINSNNQVSLESQVPMTTVMIPVTAAAQLQSASQQIQQAAMQAMISQNQTPQPQILVLMIPYVVNTPPYIAVTNPTPEQPKCSAVSRQAHSISAASNISAPNSRTMSSLSFAKHEPDKFFVKANFYYQTKAKNELSFKRGDILHIVDTFPNSEEEPQHWFVSRVNPDNGASEKGLVPSLSRAEKIVQEQQHSEYNNQKPGSSNENGGGSSRVLSASVGKVNFLKRRAARRSKSFSKDNWDNVVFEIGSCKLPAYERVVFKHPGFCRPVVIFGPLADIAREKLLRDYPERYSYPVGFNKNQIGNHPKVIRLKNIQEIIDQGKYALLDITPSAVEKLNYVNLCPIVIFMKAEKHIVKEFRQRAIKSLNENDVSDLRADGESSRKLLEQANKLEKLWSHVFTATLNLSAMGSEMWYRKLRETIENQQSMNVWMGERKQDKRISNAMSASMSNVMFPMPMNGNENGIGQSTSFIEDAGISNDDSDDSLSKSTMNLHLMSNSDYNHNTRHNDEEYISFPQAKNDGSTSLYEQTDQQQREIYANRSLHYSPYYERNYTLDY